MKIINHLHQICHSEDSSLEWHFYHAESVLIKKIIEKAGIGKMQVQDLKEFQSYI